ncbi:hypothetical protein JKP88DRAFT_274707 [Tribonema minus]|uniref:Sulfotransferase n=1 Tax=Tribonema minus TaxID=303371 RepID=A0A835ZIH3_9STRA|nr:hypothetical protein JKP88DRAFT_274707 [Tribonema minus]
MSKRLPMHPQDLKDNLYGGKRSRWRRLRTLRSALTSHLTIGRGRRSRHALERSSCIAHGPHCMPYAAAAAALLGAAAMPYAAAAAVLLGTAALLRRHNAHPLPPPPAPAPHEDHHQQQELTPPLEHGAQLPQRDEGPWAAPEPVRAPEGGHPAVALPASRPGVIVLGMHRSGTSMVTGLLARAGLNLGTRLIPARDENAKGYFEKQMVVWQNDRLLKSQHTHWCDNDIKYEPDAVLIDILKGDMDFSRGWREIRELESLPPWLLKDPRLSITLRTWLPLFSRLPAVVFVYRHPVEVAESLVARSTVATKGAAAAVVFVHRHPVEVAESLVARSTVATKGAAWRMKRAFRLWTSYQTWAITQSSDLCRAVTSNRRVVADPIGESNAVIQSLRDVCGVAVPRLLEEATIKDFVDLSLQHRSAAPVAADKRAETAPAARSACDIPDPHWELPPMPRLKKAEIDAYRDAMQLYCDMDSGEAFKPNFKFPAILQT